jgi:nuclear protein localization protein 4 homolog
MSTSEREHLFSDEEVEQMAAMHNEVGPLCVSCVVSVNEEHEVHFEAYQVSEQCARLQREGWIVRAEGEGAAPSSHVRLRNPREPHDQTPIILPTGKDVGEVDSEWFLLPVNILDHEGPLRTVFPVENRLLGQTPEDLHKMLRAPQPKGFTEKVADFHLLLWLATMGILGTDTDLALIAEAIR